MRIKLLTAAACLLGAGIVAGSASAAPGDLSFAGCIAGGGANGCTNALPGQNPLDGAEDVAVSPDGASVYVSSEYTDSISHFTVAPGGQLTFAGCIAGGGAGGCTNPLPGQNPLESPSGVAVSPNGNVYLTSFGSDSISHFTADAEGKLTFAGCVAGDGANTCTDPLPGKNPLDAAMDVTLSPNGNNLYAASFESGSLSHFTVAPGGQLTFVGCVANQGVHGCANPLPGQSGQNPFYGAQAVTVSPNGGNAYLASWYSNSISRFTLGPAGHPTFGECIASGGANTCTDPVPGPDPLDKANGVAVSPNGNSVYVTSGGGHSISHFAAAPSGQLNFAGCIAAGGLNGCTDPLPGQNPFSGPTGVAVSPNGTSVYVAAQTLSNFTAAPSGQLDFAGCLAGGGAPGCVDPLPGQNPLLNPSDLAVSSNGNHVYLASQESDSVSHFRIEPSLPVGPPPPPPGASGSTGRRAAALRKCKKKKSKKARKRCTKKANRLPE